MSERLITTCLFHGLISLVNNAHYTPPRYHVKSENKNIKRRKVKCQILTTCKEYPFGCTSRDVTLSAIDVVGLKRLLNAGSNVRAARPAVTSKGKRVISLVIMRHIREKIFAEFNFAILATNREIKFCETRFFSNFKKLPQIS